jgi:hypothetical protein
VNVYITPEEYEAAAARGISARTLNLRIRLYSWPKERAITEPVQQRTDWSEWYAVAEVNGISRGTFRMRIHKGWSPERAATELVWGREQKAAHMRTVGRKRRKYPSHIYELLRKKGINYFTFASRVRSGWSPERAATVSPRKRR